jgi:hypothetical protein
VDAEQRNLDLGQAAGLQALTKKKVREDLSVSGQGESNVVDVAATRMSGER